MNALVYFSITFFTAHYLVLPVWLFFCGLFQMFMVVRSRRFELVPKPPRRNLQLFEWRHQRLHRTLLCVSSAFMMAVALLLFVEHWLLGH
jgi:hypothetical protein